MFQKLLKKCSEIFHPKAVHPSCICHFRYATVLTWQSIQSGSLQLGQHGQLQPRGWPADNADKRQILHKMPRTSQKAAPNSWVAWSFFSFGKPVQVVLPKHFVDNLTITHKKKLGRVTTLEPALMWVSDWLESKDMLLSWTENQHWKCSPIAIKCTHYYNYYVWTM